MIKAMANYREEFQKLLESLYIPTFGDVKKIEKDINAFLGNVFQHVPEKLYRYRICNQNNIDQFAREIEIKNRNPNLKQEIASKVCHLIECGLSDQEIVDKIIDEDYADFIKEQVESMKKREVRFRNNNNTAKLGCFTESVQSKFMWDFYAEGYTGFALEYNLKELIFKSSRNSNSFLHVFPVIYTDRMPDVTNEESIEYFREISLKEDWIKNLATYYHSIPQNTLHFLKPYLYKDKAEYSHEKEWRMVYSDDNNEDFSLIPDLNCLKAIYYGPEISSDNKSKLHEIAKARGIAEYNVAFDLDSRNYNLKLEREIN